MKVIDITKEFIFEEDRPFDSAHASTLIQLEDGSILAAWFAGSWEGAPDVGIWTSVQGSAGWEPCRCVVDFRGTPLWNPVLFQKKDGTILLFFKAGVTIPEWKTWVVSSGDGGRSWSEPRELVEGDSCGGRGPVKNKPIYLENGDILAPASVEGETWDAFVDISRDGGETWEKSAMVPLRRAGYQIEMLHRPYDPCRCFGKGIIQPTLWQDGEGGVHMLLRSTSSKVFRSDSADNGRTWSLAYATEIPNNNSGLDLVRLPGGGLVLACNPVDNLPNYYKGPRTPLSLLASEDNGAKWKELAVLEDGVGGFAYPAIICNGRNEIFVTYTWKRERIAFARITYEP